jgi:hypothetical protein
MARPYHPQGKQARLSQAGQMLRKRFFFEKKNQKTSVTLDLGRDAANAPGPESKSLFASRRAFFPVFVHKKKFLLQFKRSI